MDHPRKPNLLFVLADQLRAASLPANDSNVRAPNLQRLANEGMSLSRTYSSNPVCSPARATIMSGMYSHTHGLVSNDLRLRTDFVPIAKVYANNGYKTGYIGKWHIDGAEKPGFVPTGPRRQGFEYWAAFNRGHEYWNSVYFGDDSNPIRMSGYEPDYQTDLAIEFIKDQRDRPFCLFVSWGPPHTPFFPRHGERDERWNNVDPSHIVLRPNVPDADKPRASREIAGYNTHITALDGNLGRLISALETFGISGNTILVFTSDHGDMLGSHGLYRKGVPEEESIHIPFIIRYPGRIQAGSTNEVMFQTVDFMPTLLALSGLAIPDTVQGSDVSNSLLRNDPRLGPALVYLEGKIGDPQEFRVIQTKRHMLSIRVADLATTHMYDMGCDPYQLNNLAGREGQSEVEERLRAQLFDWAKQTLDRSVVNELEASVENRPGYLIVMPWEVTDQGGVNGVVRHLVAEMDVGGRYKPILLENDWSRTGSYRKPWSGVPVSRVRLRAPIGAGSKRRCRICSIVSYVAGLPSTLYKLKTIVKNFQVQVINVHYPSSDSAVFAILRKFGLFNGKLILTFHNSDATENLKLRGLNRYLYRMLLRDADVIVSVSRQLIETIVDGVPGIAAKVRVIYNGVDLRRFPDASSDVRHVRLRERDKIIICVAAFELRKGLDVLLHAFGEVRSIHDGVRLMIVGESGGDDDSLMELATRLGVAPHVEWRCGVGPDEVAQLMMQADVFVLPSRDEGFPLALLEAGAAALPVVATRVGGVPELIVDGENGLLVDSEDAKALAAALLRILDDPAMAEVGARLRKDVAERFTWGDMYREYARVAGPGEPLSVAPAPAPRA